MAIGESPFAQRMQSLIQQRLIERDIAHVCYQCATPTIIEIEKITRYKEERNPPDGESIILEDLRRIGQGLKTTLVSLIIKEPNQKLIIWGTPQENKYIRDFVENDTGSTGYISSFAPSRT